MKRHSFAMLGCVIFFGVPVVRGQQPSGGREGRETSMVLPVLRKRTEDLTASLAGRRHDVSIKLFGLQSADLVNIRAGGARVHATAGTVARRPPDGKKRLPLQLLTTGPPPPDSALQVSPNEVSFNRLVPEDLIVFLDVEVPPGTTVRVLLDGEAVLKTSIRQPLALRNREWGQGAPGAAGALARVFSPGIGNAPTGEAVYNTSTGRWVVPPSKLQVLRRRPIGSADKTAIVAVVDIDETGRVAASVPLTDNPPAGLDEVLRRWRFAPYIVGGVAVPITTTLLITVD